jgi:hypothetical protein
MALIVKPCTHTVLGRLVWARIMTPGPCAVTRSSLNGDAPFVVMPAGSTRDAPDAKGTRVEVNMKTRDRVFVSCEVVMPTLAPVE